MIALWDQIYATSARLWGYRWFRIGTALAGLWLLAALIQRAGIIN